MSFVITGYVSKNSASGSIFNDTDMDIPISLKLLGNDSAATANAEGPVFVSKNSAA